MDAVLEWKKAHDIYEKHYGKNHIKTLYAQQEVERLKDLKEENVLIGTETGVRVSWKS